MLRLVRLLRVVFLARLRLPVRLRLLVRLRLRVLWSSWAIFRMRRRLRTCLLTRGRGGTLFLRRPLCRSGLRVELVLRSHSSRRGGTWLVGIHPLARARLMRIRLLRGAVLGPGDSGRRMIVGNGMLGLAV